MSPRVLAYIKGHFSPQEAAALEGALAGLGGEVSESGADFSERIASSIIIVTERDFGLLDGAISLTKSDWRDILSSAGLQHADWRLGVEALLGPELDS
jgi:hypothetical protein